MKSPIPYTLAKVVLMGTAFILLQACTPNGVPDSYDKVSEAFETSGIIVMKPYTRTIFNTSNF